MYLVLVAILELKMPSEMQQIAIFAKQWQNKVTICSADRISWIYDGFTSYLRGMYLIRFTLEI